MVIFWQEITFADFAEIRTRQNFVPYGSLANKSYYFVLVLRAIYCNTRSSYDELLRKAKLTTLGCRRLQDIAIIMYKAKYNICPPYIKDIFKLDKPRYGLRNSGDFFIPRYNTTTYGRHT